MLDRRRFAALSSASTLVAALGAPPARAQTTAFPMRFVRLIVPFPAGGGTDVIARILANRLSVVWGQQMVVENKGGGATSIGTEAVAKSDPDGYAVLLQSLPLAVNKFLFKTLPYDPVADLAPVSLVCDYPNIMAVPASSPAHTVQEFIEYARANPGKATYASSGHGTSVHLSGELFNKMTGLKLLHVPYRGAGPALNDLIPGRVDVMFNNTGAVLPLIAAGKLRALGITSQKRLAVLPGVPTVSEAGVPGFDVTGWYAMFVQAKTPEPVIRKMHADTVTALADPDTRAKLEQAGVGVVGSSPEELRAHLAAEMAKWGAIIAEAGIKVE
ncbi:Bug family tripartite tricarboxylate transporter substrate binding protein [Rhodoplanes sp. Z2-YC6860]|uniref:Bug family tripartite tricarboxylate transporter substrate binding protein n=1 Tax=Rhodoplanes sp. Z2-YC6860 TaxID=674703 RepID=UPI00078C405C|nr:tripartite tricarboxylate transporter substrate binding protein [Rhodoplanes sp. Z2-YC6860]AMN44737.1 extra-cytoplasmic solute receptor [Rhodoplanes sp. Z2-YC6860]